MNKSSHTSSFIISFLFVFLISNQVFAAAPKVETYDELIHAIRQARAASELRVKQEKVRLAWETGKLIDEHILKNAERADYGAKVIIRLAQDLETSETELRYMLQFAREYPIHPEPDELTWTDYRELLSLNDSKEREALAAQAKKEKWDMNRIRKEIKRINAAKAGKSLPLEALHATPGKPGVYRVIRAKVGPYEGQLALDLGFSNYYQPAELNQFKEGELIFAERETDGYALSRSEQRSDHLFTYRAYIIRVIDGDTFTAIIDLGFEFVTEQKLRLRGLDAPEIDTVEGKKAKEFLEQKLKKGAPVLIKTEKSDKYDRYLADVFVDGKYLNQELLDKDLAVSVSS